MKKRAPQSLRGRVVAASLIAVGLLVAIMLASGPTLGPVGTLGRDGLDWLFGGLAFTLPVEMVVAGVLLLGRRGPVLPTLSLAAGDAGMGLGALAVFESGALGQFLGEATRSVVATTGTVLVAIAAAVIVVVSRTSLLALAAEGVLSRIDWANVRSSFGKHVRAMYVAARPAPAAIVASRSATPTPAIVVEPAPAPAATAPAALAATQDEAPVALAKSPVVAGAYRLPALDVLGPKAPSSASAAEPGMAERLVTVLGDYGVAAKVARSLPGPTVTTYEVAVATGTKLSKLVKLGDELALALGCKVRVVPSRAGLVGFEIPNEHRAVVGLRDLLETDEFRATKAALPVVLGRDMQGAPVIADLAAMPHVIVAGASGSGKSVGLNAMLASLLCKRTPDELRLLMIDPKVVELAPYASIPHMLMPVVTDMKEAAAALAWAVSEMERRYGLFAQASSKNIASFNAKASTGEKLPYIVIVVDEVADLIMQQGKEVESSIARLGQKARAAGMHVILATQRPSVDVITGTIKANFSSRIAYRVAQAVDSRTILDEQGAEALLGAGDMLVKLNGAIDTKRVQCPMVTEEQVDALVASLHAQHLAMFEDTVALKESPFAAEWKRSRMVQLMPAMAS